MAYDLTGQVFGRLTVVGRAPKGDRKTAQLVWECRCECGNTKDVVSANLRNTVTQSCGCLHRERASEAKTTHGMSRSRTYKLWQNMIERCTNPAVTSYQYYGGKGITVDPAWMTFEGFLDDMGEAGPGMSLERKDNDKNYCRDNCVWIPRPKQNDNRSITVMVEYRGETKTLADWSEEVGVCRATLYQRIFVRGWPVEKAMTEPPMKRRGKTTGVTVNEKNTARRKVQVAVRNGSLHRPDRCTAAGCDRTDIQAHHHNGYAPEHALDVLWLCPAHHPKHNERYVEWQGRTMTIREWARETGIPYKTLRGRLWANEWKADENVFSPETDRRCRRLTLNGETKSVTEWSKELGITMQTIIQRLKKGLPLDKVLSRERLKS